MDTKIEIKQHVTRLMADYPEIVNPAPVYQHFDVALNGKASFRKISHDSRLLGATSFYSPFSTKVSSSRNAMVTNQKGQAIPIKGSETPRILHGFETQEAEYCLGAKAPCDMEVVDIISCILSGSHGTEVPVRSVIYEDLETGQYGILHIDNYTSYHDTFGFKVELSEEMQNLQVGDTVKKGTVLSHSRNIKDGFYGTGINANCVYISDPATIEDGFLVSEEFLERLTPTALGSREANFGTDWYPLNLYGDDKTYKAFPDVGQRVREDGILMAFRRCDDNMDAVNLLPSQLRKVDTVTDRVFYVDPNAMEFGATVIDVNVVDSENEGMRQTIPSGMVDQVKRYGRQWSQYHDKLLRVYNHLTRDRGVDPHKGMEPSLLDAVYCALIDKPNEADRQFIINGRRDNKKTRTYRGEKLNEFRVVIKFQYDFPLRENTKLTDMYGGKGVICGTLPRSAMPTDEAGNVADVAIFFRSGIARLNPGQFFEQYITAHMRDVTNTIRQMVAQQVPPMEIYDFVARYYDIISPIKGKIFRTMPESLMEEEIREIVRDGLYTTIKTSDSHCDAEFISRCENFQPVTYTPVTYQNQKGETVVSDVPMLIGSKYMILLDKTDPKPMACATPLRQHHRLPAVPNPRNRYVTPSKVQAARAWGESELQVNGGAVGGQAMADVMDMTTNPRSTREVTYNIMDAENPSDIESVIDRELHPLGDSSSLRYVENLLFCFGAKINKEDIDD